MALRGTLTHRKTRRLAQRLGIDPCFALGLVEALWNVTAEQSQAGDIGRMSNDDIAMEMFYSGDPEALVEALVWSGFVDNDPEHRLLIHDWNIHSDDATDNRISRSGNRYANGAQPRMRKLSLPERAKLCAQHGYDVRTPSAHVSTESHEKALPVPVPEPEPEPSTKSKAAASAFVLPDWIDPIPWNAFEEMRKKLRKAMTDHARGLAVKDLLDLRNKGHSPSDILNQSIMRGWTGLFEIKGVSNGTHQGNKNRGSNRVAEQIEELAKAGVTVASGRAEAGSGEDVPAAGRGDRRDSPGVVLEGFR